jgi:hypothetical protein
VKRLKSLRPSPAMVVALVALFAALGGSAYAASQIGTKQIKNNAITTSKIKKNAVTAAKIKNGAVTGSKIQLSTLGTVPSATHATTADSATKAAEATTAQTAGTATNFSRYFTSGLKKASIGQKVTLLTVGNFTFTGVCGEEGGETTGEVMLTTSTGGANAYTYENEGYWQSDFEPGDELEVDYRSKDSGPEASFWSTYYTAFAAESGNGDYLLEGNANSAVNSFGANCAFEVSGLNNA